MSIWPDIEITPGVSVRKSLFDGVERAQDESSDPSKKPRGFEISFWRCKYEKIKEWHCFEIPLKNVETVLNDIDFWISDKKPISAKATRIRTKLEGHTVKIAFYNEDKIYYYDSEPRQSNYYNAENNKRYIALFAKEVLELKKQLIELTTQEMMAV
jgi:hypothetical protein